MKMKNIFIINGKGGCGKDTLVNCVTEHFPGLVLNKSAISPIKEMARLIGWNEDKSLKGRKFLADLRELVSDYNDGTTRYLVNETSLFLADNIHSILFIHIREPEMIERYVTSLRLTPNAHITSILVKRNTGIDVYGNSADDNVENYNYDVVFSIDDIDKQTAGNEFVRFIEEKVKGDA